ncbi:hypothetical protein DC522_12880 [Microvirga sp. KLBC 81]|uniref:Uncharacterized protein n=1 Tax=Microvirga vignae TaxID=1225564 RepID=A0A0H1R4L5_9HYPH|nr:MULTISPECIES: hypothetical protein [Microvirga]KLK90160.1 hypothetical protein AA309_27345 [Microvirga vignae]PVE23994.1 hypothetical protein DC522_12880 [Microvirga sp. KLBC 81]
MTDPHHLQETDLVEHNGYQIRLSPSGLEWMVFVALPKQRPTLIMAPDREAALAKAYEWIEAQRRSEKDAQ